MKKYENSGGEIFPIPGNETIRGTFKSLVPIKTLGNKLPLYIIHGLGLNVLNLKDLAYHLNAERPVLGLQAKGLDGIEEPLDNLQSMARHYMSEILEHNPSGPYALAGYSSGGLIAFEIKSLLELMGKDVRILAILDGSAEILDNANLKSAEKLRRKLHNYWWNVKHPLLISGRKIDKMNRLVGNLFTRHGTKNYYSLLDHIIEKHKYAINNYIPTKSNGVIYLFRAQTRNYFEMDREFLGWKRYTGNEVKVLTVPGDHFTMLKLPHVKELADVLDNVLENC